MSLEFNKPISSPFEQQIKLEEEKYVKAFKADATFQVMKEIRENIKRLKMELNEQQ